MYQLYDFKQELDIHIDKKIPITLKDKNSTFIKYLFKLNIFKLDKRITKSHELFQEDYFLFIKSNIIFIAKKIGEERFDNIEVLDGLKTLRKLKLKQLFK
jgi:hypothetical protein